MADAAVVELAEYVKAQRAREALVRLLAPYPWFLGVRLELKPDGQVVLVVLSAPPTDPVQRTGILARVASHLDGVPIEERSAATGPIAGPARRL